jgi:hypothetical protein
MRSWWVDGHGGGEAGVREQERCIEQVHEVVDGSGQLIEAGGRQRLGD